MVIISLPQAGDNNQFITDLVFTYAPECAMLYSQQCVNRHLERRLPWADVSGVLAVILSAAKDLFIRRARPFAALRVTGVISTCLVVSPDRFVR